MPNDSFFHYNALDGACMVEAHNKFWPDIATGGFEPAYKMTIDLIPVLMFIQTRGIKVSMDELAKTRTQIEASAAEKQLELNKLCGRELNVNSPKECQAYFYIEKGISPYHNDEGRVTVDDLALQRMARGTAKRPGLREAKLVQEIRGLQKLKSTYLDMEFDADDRIRCSTNPRGTKFGRISTSATIFGTGGNLQNLHPEFKQFLGADDGYVLWEVDKRLAEWAIVAYLSNDASMLKAIEDGLDVHCYTGSMMFDAPMEIVQLESKLVGMNTDPELIGNIRSSEPALTRYLHKFPRTMSGRQMGKRSNHGLNYDEGYAKFSLINEVEQSEGKRCVELYHRVYPGVRQTFHAGIKYQLQKDRTLTNCFGRKIRFLDQWGPDLWKAAYSALPQSTQVDALNRGMIATYHDDWLCEGPGGIDVLAQVHDSILMQVPMRWFTNEGAFEGAMERIYKYLSPELEYNGRKFCIENDSKIGLNWGGYHKDNNPKGMREIKSMSDVRRVLGELGCLNERTQTGLIAT